MTVEGNAVPTNPRSSNSNYRYIVYSHKGRNSVNHDLGRISLRYRGLGQGSQEWGHHREGWGGGRGGGAQQSFIWGGFAQSSNPLLSLFINTIFSRKGSPFLYLLSTNTRFRCLATTAAQADGLLAKNFASRQVNALF